MPELLADVKLRLRISSSSLDSEISDLIAAAEKDLDLAGVTVDTAMPLVKEAIIIYCKGRFGLENQDAERYMASYDALKTHLVLTGGESIV
jgi:hypothetical protein